MNTLHFARVSHRHLVCAFQARQALEEAASQAKKNRH
jgi:hypothetical protein